MGKSSYNIGLDIGTASVGWAVTDLNGDLLKFKRKNMWGVRLFSEAETAQKRRVFRSSRRRLKRRKTRIALLQDLLADDILKIDEAFYIRLKESFLHKADRSTRNESTLFNDKLFKDKEYYKSYPTIYHLREELINTKEKKDIRLIYLALHHLIKYRGNFLHDNLNLANNSTNIYTELANIFQYFKEELGYNFNSDAKDIKELFATLKDDDLSRRDKEREIRKILKADRQSKTPINNFIKAILGYSADFSKIFNIDIQDNKLKFALSKEYDEIEKQELLEEYLEQFANIVNIYNDYTLGNILKGEKYISNGMVKKYEKHKADLLMLKNLIKTHYSKDDYNKIFKDKTSNVNNYPRYVGKSIGGRKKCDADELYSFINKILISKEEILGKDKKYRCCILSMENGDFLPKINTVENAAIPYQLNLIELEMIIDNQSQHYNTLKKNKDKILKILEFKIPYYVGPLNPNRNEFAWMKKRDGKENEKIYPWNFEDIVDIDLAAEKFIKRMRNNCTYLPEEEVIPKNSLLYSEFTLLNELNKIRVNGQLLDVRDKKLIINDLFKKKKKVTKKDLINWLKINIPIYEKLDKDKIDIEGFQKEKEFASSLGSYIDFSKILGKINQENYQMIEELIKWITLFEDKKILKRKIIEKYPQISHNSESLNRIISLPYTGWARLSKKLINGIKIYKNNYYGFTIIKQLRESNMNFMQIINDNKLGFNKIIKEHINLIHTNKITYDDISQLQGSPALKRGIWQTVRIVDELIKIMGQEPENIFIEFAREEGIKKRTTSRVDRLLKIYEDMAEDTYIHNAKTYSQLKNKKKEKNKLDTRRLYLYFIQNGKCMYTAKNLDINKLHLYEIDHIIPQSYIKDDSIENTVLVEKNANQYKTDNMLLSSKIRRDRQISSMWKYLFKYGLMGAKKYRNLQRSFVNDEELKGFINRQLVETRQISKHLASMFTQRYENTDTITIKAELISNFRKQFDLYKLRNLNDYHHAHDAYLASVVGNFIINRFPKIQEEFKYGDYIKQYKKNREFLRKNKSGLVIGAIIKNYETDDFKWIINNEVDKIKKSLNYKDCFITKKVEEQTGEFYNQTIYPSKINYEKTIARIPIKKGLDPKKYGGYSGENKAYIVAFEHKKGKRTVKSTEAIPIYLAKTIKNNEDLMDYLKNTLAYKEVRILHNKLRKFQLIYEDGHPIYVVSDTEKHNAKQLLVDKKYYNILYKLEDNKYDLQTKDEELINEFYSYFVNKLQKQYPIYANIATKLGHAKEEFVGLPLEEKAEFVTQMLNITKANATVGNFQKFKLSYKATNAGRVYNSSYKIDKIEVVDQSITGLFEKRYTL